VNALTDRPELRRLSRRASPKIRRLRGARSNPFSSAKNPRGEAGCKSSPGAATASGGPTSAGTQGVCIAALWRRLRTPRWAAFAAVIVVVGAALLPASAQAFAITEFNAEISAEGGAAATLAGSHPYSLTTSLGFALAPEPPAQSGGPYTDGDLRDLSLELPPGLIENPGAVPKCSQAQFEEPRSSPFESPSASGENCPSVAQVGLLTVRTLGPGAQTRSFGLFNLAPPPGVASELGASPYGVPLTFDTTIRGAEGQYGLTLTSRNVTQAFDLAGLELTVWGTPWGVSHNGERGNCLNEAEPSFPWAKCSVGPPLADQPLAYLTLPTSCEGAPTFTVHVDSWQGASSAAGDQTPPLEGCASLGFDPHTAAQLSDRRASSASGLEFSLSANNEALTIPILRVPSPVRRAVIVLPEGITLNPSLGAGLGVCTPGGYEAETASSPPGAGCPNDSKIGDFTVRSPLYEEAISGSIFLAQPGQNPFGSLLAVYLVAKAPTRGILVKVAGELHPDPATGRLTASFEDLPQLPYSELAVHFREGQRAPLVTPPACGAATTAIELTPWQGALAAATRSFESKIESGVAGGPCPSGAVPFAPGARAGMLNSAAGAYTPFYLHLTRTDSEQEITSYSTVLPPGLLGDLSGVAVCPDAAIEAAEHAGGAEETAHPSCPAASQIGRTVSGFGVGPVLAYAPGGLYLAGPFHGAPLSIVAIDAATVGPFDLGTVVVRSAIEVDPHSAQVRLDSAASDPIPHILSGVPLHLRDIRVYIDRPHFTLNPTSCNPFTVASTLTGSAAPFTDPRSTGATVTAPFQASSCASLGFRPKLSLRLKGGTKRGDYPSLHAALTPRPGDANIGAAQVALPSSELLAQEHIGVVCPRPRLEAGTCPSGSAYGRASATTPLLAEPMSGPVYLATGFGHTLPDLVAQLHGHGITIEVDGRIDSVDGGLRGTFEALPDAPVSKFSMALNGGKRGLLVNERNICSAPQTATARFTAQDNSVAFSKPKIAVKCPKPRKAKHHKKKHRRRPPTPERGGQK
jgi:hypothetical protein